MSSPRIQRLLSVLLGAAILIVAAWLSTRHSIEADWTASNRNSLTEQSKRLLDSLDSPIRFTAYVYANSDVRREINARIAPWQRQRPDIQLEFVDPALDPQAVRSAGVSADGELVISYQGRSENLRTIGEPAISAALQRLAYSGKAVIRILAGHGERSPDEQDQAGYSELASALADKGLSLQTLQFIDEPSVPSDTDLLIVAAPQREPLPAEIDRIAEWVSDGGNLLWLSDPDSPPLPALATALEIEMLPGTVIYQDYEILGTSHPGLALVGRYPGHAITAELVDLTVFPIAGGMVSHGTATWSVTNLLSSPPRSWLEISALDEQLVFDPAADRNGPITMGIAQTRVRVGQDDSASQRVVVIADSDFLSNAFIRQLGNRQLSFNILQWLVGRDAQIDVDVPPAPDISLNLSPLMTTLIGLVFVLLAPALLTAGGLLSWWTRQRRRS